MSGAHGAVVVPLPMFPLGSVLFPHMPLALHVFEMRYRTLVRDCLRHGNEFGVVLIERGAEVGGGETRFRLGTVARIVEAAPLADGRWELLCLGTRRVRVTAWLPDDPYPVALVEELPDPPVGPEAAEAMAAALVEVRRSLTLAEELGEPSYPAATELAGDAQVAAHQLCAIAPLGPADQQRLLETDGPAERLTLLAEMAAGASDLFNFRLSGP
ncbi:MAG: LON peptidase substrate-binding domain-containing protein [Acidimicrobiales bacterium]